MAGIVVGIDLGAAYSAISHIRADGRTEAIPNALGEALTPSAVRISGFELRVGQMAYRERFSDPYHVAYGFKQSLGDPEYSFQGHTAADLTTAVLRQLVEDAEAHLGMPVSEAVVTHPAHYGARGRTTMRVLGAVALTVLSVTAWAQTEQGTMRVRDLRAHTGEVVTVKGRAGQIIEAEERAGVRVYSLRDDYGSVVNIHTGKDYPIFGTTLIVSGKPVADPASGRTYLEEQSRKRAYPPRDPLPQLAVVKGRVEETTQSQESAGVRLYSLRDEDGDVVTVRTDGDPPSPGSALIVTGKPVTDSASGETYLEEQSRDPAYDPWDIPRKLLPVLIGVIVIIVVWVMVRRRSAGGLPEVWGYAETVSGPHQGKSFALRGADVIVGRGQDALLAVDLPLDASVSREHGRIVRDGEAVYYEDSGSTYGSWVNEQQMQGDQRVQLAPEALIRLGPNTVIRVGQVGAAAAGATRFADDENDDEVGNAGESPTRRAGATRFAEDEGDQVLPQHTPAPDRQQERTSRFHFSAFYPEKVGPQDVSRMIAYAHLPTVAAQVVEEARERLELRPGTTLKVASDTPTRSLPRECLIRVTPDIPGLQFDRLEASMSLWEEVQSVEFRFRPDSSATGQLCRGWLHFWLDCISVGDLAIDILVSDEEVPELFRDALARANAPAYRTVFPSYSHEDAEIVERIEAYAEAFGDRYLRDLRALRSGQHWPSELARFIEQADVFQLFWSERAMGSEYVKKEWRHALGQRVSRPDPYFVRPVYWTPKPATPIPSELSELHFARVPPEYAGG